MPILMLILLTLVWLAISATWTLPNLFLGLLLAATVLFIVRHHLGTPVSIRRPRKILVLLAVFAVELMKSVWNVVKAVLKPTMDVSPGIIIYPLQLKSDFQIALLGNMITLTPGTLTVDVTSDRSHLVIHALDCRDPDATRRDIQNGFERRILEAFE
ncbi:Na+/H+ antiporter subunit E [Tianweitania sediminis]|uniref:Na+/H+ antiporter subunit E n=2 Tax=Tianweitania sediminis TaxID=1502156 RepID=A0A8J7UH65_9HYPH|nr:Na+/H+ antiporter subunit E [Tianweitania sediminis]MBP0438874.1 Na+/H+ antiporter subunit E [Tianweitania sediminis]